MPQFIDIEDKLFGPFSFRQFAYLVGGGGLIYLLFRVLPLWIAIIPMLLVGGLTGLLTFYRINNKPFAYYLQAGISYFISNKLYIWKQRLAKPDDKKEEVASEPISVLPNVSVDSIKDLSWSLDVEDKNNS
ncbi:MAG: PrgI family protein [Candidatus Pacebacteria bacterium]|nr:PrgI family protein [Candidatus Paceibacterota bacterium]